MMKTLPAMFKSLCKEIEHEFIKAKIDYEETVREWQGKINDIGFWDMRCLENCITEFSQYHYKIGHNETNLDRFYSNSYI